MANYNHFHEFCNTTNSGNNNFQNPEERIYELEIENRALKEQLNRLTLTSVNNKNHLLQEAEKMALIGGWEYNVLTKKLTLTQSSMALYRVNPDTFTGTIDEIIAIVHPDDKEYILKAFENSKEQKCVIPIKYRILTPGRKTRTISLNGEVEFDHDERLVRMYGCIRDITEHEEALEKLKKSEERFRMLAHNSKDAIYRIIFNPDIAIEYVSPAIESILGYSPDDFYYDPSIISRIIHPDEFGKLKYINNHLEDYDEGSFKCFHKDGYLVWIEFRMSFIRNRNNKIIGMEGVARDITLRKEVELSLKKSLHEKELLIDEINHRVKNNLNVVLSLIEFQKERITNIDFKQILNKLSNRIYSIALIHHLLYRSSSISLIDFKNYLASLAIFICKSYKISKNTIWIDYKTDIIHLNINTIKTLGLIANELIINAIKHAFNEFPGAIKVIFEKRDDHLALIVKDNGCGIISHDDDFFEKGEVNSTGLFLVKLLCQEIEGSLSITNDDGARVSVSFPIEGHTAINDA